MMENLHNISHGLLYDLIDSIPFPLVLITGKGHVLLYNPMARDIIFSFYGTEIKKNEFFISFIKIEDKDFISAGSIKKIIRSKRLIEKGEDLNGNEFWLEYSISPVQGSSGRDYMWISMTDITAQMKSEKALKKARDEVEQIIQGKTEFIANMSHEIKTPLNSLSGFAEMLKMSGLNKIQDEYTDIMIDSISALNFTINNILDFSKIEKGNFDPEPVKFNPLKEFEYVAELMAASMSRKGLNYNVYVEPMFPALLTGASLWINQVLINLLNNAVKFTQEGGNVDFVVTLVKGNDKMIRIRFEVSDTGCGISPDNRDKIFEAFFQADSSVSRRHSGTGLGLSISRSIISKLGGMISLKSLENIGSTFSFELDFEVVNRGTALRRLNSEMFFFICDPEKGRLKFIEKYAQSLGFDFMILKNPKQAGEIIADAVFIDMSSEFFLKNPKHVWLDSNDEKTGKGRNIFLLKDAKTDFCAQPDNKFFNRTIMNPLTGKKISNAFNYPG